MPDNVSFLVRDFESMRGDPLLDAPVDALAGVSAADADALDKSLGIRSIRDLARNRFVAMAQALMAVNDDLDPRQAGRADFLRELEARVGALLGNTLDGPFLAVNLPSGFNYGVQFGTNADYNADTLRAFDTTITALDDGGLILDGGGFSQLYASILQQTTFAFSADARRTIDEEQAIAEAQIANVITAWQQAGGTFTDPLPLGGKLQDIMNQVVAVFGSIADIPPSLNALRVALTTYQVVAQQSFALGQRFAEADRFVSRLRENVTRPTAANGGLPVGEGAHAVGWDNLPNGADIVSDLLSPDNKVEIAMQASDFSATETTLRVTGTGSVARISLGSLLSVQVGGGAAFGLDRYVASGSSVSIELVYKGLTTFSAEPRRASIDGSTGWYDLNLLREVVANTGRDRTGYILPASGEFPIDETFGEGRTFSRLKTYVISQEPEMQITLEDVDVEAVMTDFRQSAGVKLTLFGLISIGASDTYEVRSVERSTTANRISITMSAPPPSASVPLSERVAHVIGGVPSYPPTAV